jgi:predicted nucleic acid-binding protein
MRVLFDTNVVLDVLLTRAPHAEAATQLMDLVARRRLDGVLGATSVTTIHYLLGKALDAAVVRRHVNSLLAIFDVAAVTRAVLADATKLRFRDYEDAVLHEAARHSGCTSIVTRDPKDFVGSKLGIYQPAELLRLQRAVK